MAISVPKGVVKLPWYIKEDSENVTLKDATANVLSEIVDYKVPRDVSIAVRAGDIFFLDLQTAAGTDIDVGTVQLVITDANKIAEYVLFEVEPGMLDAGGTIEDREKQFKMPAGFARHADQHILIKVKAALAASKDKTKLLLTGVQFVKIG